MGLSHVEMLRPNSEDVRRPVPWRTAEGNGDAVIVVDDDGAWVTTAATAEIASVVIEAVNAYARQLGHVFETDD